jgi:hypothetical protein
VAAVLTALLLTAACRGEAGEGDGMTNPAVSSTASPVRVRLLTADGQPGPAMDVPRVVKSEAEWRAQLTPEQYRIARGKGTERAFCGLFNDHHEDGFYVCVGCGRPHSGPPLNVAARPDGCQRHDGADHRRGRHAEAGVRRCRRDYARQLRRWGRRHG